jgi:hypothetical protein
VLNLDAEDELAHIGAHTPTRATTQRLAGLLPHLTGSLVSAHDVVVWPGEAPAKGLWGRAWCPTRWALIRLERAGLRVPRAPSPAVLAQVNHRAFAHALGQALPGAGFARTRAELDALLARPPAASAEGAWLLKRPLGYAGRGRRTLRPERPGVTDDPWLDASLRAGGVQVEPLVTRELDCGLHGWLSPEGECVRGHVTLQRIDERGVWQATSLAPPSTLSGDETRALDEAFTQTSQALHAVGYFGPFGLDAYRWRSPSGEVHFQPRSELNARYSMGFAVGLPGFRAPPGLP